jgi:hypothetical protein
MTALAEHVKLGPQILVRTMRNPMATRPLAGAP